MTMGEVAKTRSGALLQSIRSSGWQSRIAVAITAILLVALLVQAVQDPAQFFSQLVIGITNGAIIALIALGYTLVYGIIELINFAHGDNFMIGSFVGLTVLGGTFFGLGLFSPITHGSGVFLQVIGVVLAMVVAMVICGLLNMGIERVAYKPLRNAPRLAVLITAIGMSFVLQNVGLVWKGPAQVPFPDLISNANLLPTESVVFRWKDLLVIAVTVPLLIVLSYFIQRTKQGNAGRRAGQGGGGDGRDQCEPHDLYHISPGGHLGWSLWRDVRPLQRHHGLQCGFPTGTLRLHRGGPRGHRQPHRSGGRGAPDRDHRGDGRPVHRRRVDGDRDLRRTDTGAGVQASGAARRPVGGAGGRG